MRICLKSSLAFGLCVLATGVVRAQSSTLDLPEEPRAVVQRFELGVGYAFLGKGVCYRNNCGLPPEVALGAAFTWNVTPHVAVDAVYDATVTAEGTPGYFSDGSVAGGQGALLAVGPRWEVRRRHYGLFIFGQTGAEIWTRALSPYVFSADGRPVNLFPGEGPRAFFAVAAGVGGEYSPGARWHLRTTVSQRYVNYGQRYQGALCATCGPAPTAWDAGDDFTVSVARGLGPELRQQGAYRNEVHPHRFLDRWNVLLITGATLASVGDAVTTQLFLDKGIPEGNPIERTFVQRGVGGDIGLGALVGVAGVGAMYGLHRMGHHWIERAIPGAILVLGARNTYLNSKVD